MKFRVLEGTRHERPDAGELLVDHGLPQEALPFLEASLSIEPVARNWNNMGKCQKHLGNLEYALECFRRAQENGNPVPVYNEGQALEDLGRFQEAEHRYDDAKMMLVRLGVEGKRQLPGAYEQIVYALACCYMRRGQFKEAWPLWDYRNESGELARGGFRTIARVPVWTGQSLAGKRLIVLREGGFGDEILYLRYLSKLQALGAHVTYYGSRGMKGLLGKHSWIDQWMDERDEADTEKFDYQIGLWSIMAVLDTCPLRISELPYIETRETLKGHVDTQVGICWAPEELPNHWRKHRAIQDELIETLRDLPVQWVSLQYDRACPDWMSDQRAYMAKGWEHTADLVYRLDAVVSTDTAILHLAGALGKPTIAVIPLLSDWKWGTEPKTTAWYPSMRLVRNTDPISFAPAVKELKHILEERFAVVPA